PDSGRFPGPASWGRLRCRLELGVGAWQVTSKILLLRKQLPQKLLVLFQALKLGGVVQSLLEILLETLISLLGLSQLLQGGVLVAVHVLDETEGEMGERVPRRVARGFPGFQERVFGVFLLQGALRGLLVEVGEVQVEQPPQLREGLGVVV